MKFNRALSIAAGTFTLAGLAAILPAQANTNFLAQGNVGDALTDEVNPERGNTPTTVESIDGRNEVYSPSPLGAPNQVQNQNQPGAQNQSRPGDVGDAIIDEAVPERPATPTTSETLQRTSPGGQGQGQGAGGVGAPQQQQQRPLPGAQNQSRPGDVGDPIIDEAVPERPNTPTTPETLQRSQPSGQGQGVGGGFGGMMDRQPGQFGTRPSDGPFPMINETFVNFNYGRRDSNDFPNAVGDTYKDKIGPELTNVYRLQNQ
jgi:hypothetical protein